MTFSPTPLQPGPSVLLSSLVALLGLSVSPPVATAQVTADQTMPGENTVVTPNGDIYEITGGAVRDSTLLHSFDEFSLSNGETASFDHGLNINTIFGRVTGSSASFIDGIIRTNPAGNADLFLINPQGILFGPNATLDVQGSFFASTAERVLFADGTDFSAINPQPVTFTVNQPIGLGLGSTSGSIENQAFLEVPWGEALALIGNGIGMPGGGLLALSGVIDVASVAAGSTVTLVPPSGSPGSTWGFTYEEVDQQDLRDIQLSDRAFIEVTSDFDDNPSGRIQVRGGRISIDDSLVFAFNFGASKGGTLSVLASEQLTLSNGARIDTSTIFGNGAAGDLTINVPGGRLELQGGSAIGASTFDRGDAGNLTIDVSGGTVDLFNSSLLAQAETNATGAAGTLTLRATDLSVDGGSVISTSTLGAGNGGELTIEVAETVELLNNSFLRSQARPSATGDAGRLMLRATDLSVHNSSIVSTSTFGAGAGGELKIEVAETVELLDNSRLRTQSEIGATGDAGTLMLRSTDLSLGEGSTISASTLASGAGGELTIEVAETVELFDAGNLLVQAGENSTGVAGILTLTATDLTISDGSIVSTSAQGAGAGGELTIEVAETVALINNSRLLAESELGATGAAGLLTLSATDLSVGDGSIVSTSTLGPGAGGELTIDVSETVDLNNNSFLGAQAESGATGAAGTVALSATDLSVGGGSSISTSTFGAGNGGELTIDVSEAIELNNNSSLRAQSEAEATGAAGTVALSATDLSIGGGSRISTSTLGAGAGGELTIDVSETVDLNNNSFLGAQAEPGATGAAGTVALSASDLSVGGGSIISTSTFGEGDSGELTIDVSETVDLNDGRIRAQSELGAEGAAGALTLSATDLKLNDGSVISTSTFGEGAGADLTIEASERVNLLGNSRILARSNMGAEGDPSSLTVTTPDLSLQGGSEISTSTTGDRPGGNLVINAEGGTVDIIGVSPSASPEEREVSSAISAITEGAGAAGTIDINTGRLLVQEGGRIVSGTRGSGDGGSITIDANESIVVQGASETGRRSWIAAAASDEADAEQAGTLTLETGKLVVQDGAAIFTSTDGVTDGGELTVSADTVILSGRGTPIDDSDSNPEIDARINAASGLYARTEGAGDSGRLTVNTTGTLLIQDGARISVSTDEDADPNAPLGTVRDANITARSIILNDGRIEAESLSGNGGNLNLTVEDLILLRNGSLISATAGTADAGGDGGRIVIDIEDGFIVAFPRDNNDIIANAYTGDGGRITITATGLYGFIERDGFVDGLDLNGVNDISASSKLGRTGIVNLNTLVVDPSQGLATLADDFVDPDSLIANSCLSEDHQTEGRFVLTGSGSPPRTPEDAIASNYSTGQVRLLPDSDTESAASGWQPGDPIIEPERVIQLTDGRVAFTRDCAANPLPQVSAVVSGDVQGKVY